jgi:hypothetical protein
MLIAKHSLLSRCILLSRDDAATTKVHLEGSVAWDTRIQQHVKSAIHFPNPPHRLGLKLATTCWTWYYIYPRKGSEMEILHRENEWHCQALLRIGVTTYIPAILCNLGSAPMARTSREMMMTMLILECKWSPPLQQSSLLTQTLNLKPSLFLPKGIKKH